MTRPALLAALLLLGPGCRSYLVPFDERPLPPLGTIATRAGGRLDVDADGALVARNGAGDVAAALGVELTIAPEGGLLVTHRLRPDASLRPGDRIVAAAPVAPPGGAAVLAAHRAALSRAIERAPEDRLRRTLEDPPGTVIPADRGADALEAFDPTVAALEGAAQPRPALEAEPLRGDAAAPTSATTPAAVRARPGAHPVRTADDLRGYLAGLGWAELDLVVVHAGEPGDEELVVRAALRDDPRAVGATAPWRPALARWHGLDLARVADLPVSVRPAAAADDDLLVVRVARDAPAGRAGLRPLDLVPAAELPALLPGPDAPDDGPAARVVGGDGREKRLHVVPRRHPTYLWVPFLFVWESDGARLHLGVGPLDLLVHVSLRTDYSPTSDAHERTWRWSAGTSVQGAGVDGPGGTRRTAGINLVFDGARMAYWREWWEGEAEAARRRTEEPDAP